MKRKLFIVLLVLAGALCYGQERTDRQERTPEVEAEKQTRWMERELGLTESQVDTIYKLNLRFAKIRREEAPREVIRARMDSLSGLYEGVLTAEQVKKYREKREEIRQKRQLMRIEKGE